jgi:RNA polymerase sigma factor (sigma-70 family)
MSADQKKQSLQTFFKNEAKRLKSYVRRFIDDTAEEDAEDIIQDVMLGIFDRADITAPIENLAAYVYRSLYNRIVDRYRRSSRGRVKFIDSSIGHGNDHTLSDLLSDVRYDVHTELEKKRLREDLFEAVDSLKPNLRAVFIATEFEGRSFRELSELWNVPIGTLLSQKHRAMEKIKSALTKYSQNIKE